jgi:hypothetical protein
MHASKEFVQHLNFFGVGFNLFDGTAKPSPKVVSLRLQPVERPLICGLCFIVRSSRKGARGARRVSEDQSDPVGLKMDSRSQ